MADLTGMMQAAAGAAGEENLYVEDVFSTYLYMGNSTTGGSQTITNGIDLATEGGLVWIKSRSTAANNSLYDTARGAGTGSGSSLNKTLSSNSDISEGLGVTSDYLSAFYTTGFNVTQGGSTVATRATNYDAVNYCSWTFRKAPKFFDVVTYTGNGVTNRQIAHSLDSTPGCLIVKRRDGANDSWAVWHRSLSAGNVLELSLDQAQSAAYLNWFGSNLPTSTHFNLGTDSRTNASGVTYVAYLFAHDAGGFGDDGLQNVITCGTFTGAATVNLGYEPQWVLIKRTDSTGNWILVDNMRGFPVSGNPQQLQANTTTAETSNGSINVNATGFKSNLSSGQVFIYIAIRRGPMKTPTAGTEVYNAVTYTGNVTARSITGVGFPTDLTIIKDTSNGALSSSPGFYDRLRGATNRIFSSGADAESSVAQSVTGFDLMDGIKIGTDSNVNFNAAPFVDWNFRRAPGVFDIVCYPGTGVAKTETHNLGVVPELIIVKSRSSTDNWAVYYGDNTDYLVLNSTAATADNNSYWNDTSPTSTVFTVGTVGATNELTRNYVAYLFASLAGVSKIGTYTGNGSSVTVTTGFQPRFIFVKRINSTGNWIIGDSARGLVAGDDPALFFNTAAAQTTGQDWMDVSATGFTVNATALNANVNTGIYLYLAIA